jgi:ABC-type multidrug transport system, ATPase component
MEYLLSTNSLTKRFKKQTAVDHVSLHVKSGAIYGFIGRNGAGKTTFLKMISGLSTPTSGDISLFGYSGQERKKVLSRIGVLIEAPGLYPGMSAYDNLRLKCICVGIKKDGYIESVLKTVGLETVGKKKVKNFSLGMKQRLGIGMALIGEPDLLALDEPINGLDPQGIADVRDTIFRLNRERNITIMISSHILEELSKIATNYGIIHEGRLIKELTNKELAAECSERIEIKLSHPELAIPVLDRLGFTKYKIADQNTIQIFERLDESGMITMELAKQNIVIQSITVTGESIESYFLNLTGGTHHA